MSTGICDRIKAATLPQQVANLLEQATQYKYASDVTRRRWVRLAEKAIKKFEADPRAKA